MTRIMLAAAFTGLVLNGTSIHAQSWMFQPSTYNQPHGPQAPQSVAKPHAYATFTESQAAQAAKLPKPTFHWDPSGLGGRMRRFETWGHQETMEANRLRTYAQGVRDAVGAPIWTWNSPTPQPIPQIVAPTATSAGKTLAAPRP